MKANPNRKTSNEKVPGVDSVVVSVDFTRDADNSVLIVGRKHNGKIDIINAIQGSKAEELYYYLLGKDAQVFKDEVSVLRGTENG